MGPFMNCLACNVYIVTLLEYVAQLHDVPQEVVQAELRALRKLAPGPGNWIMPTDLANLKKLGFTTEFRLIQRTAAASKLRLCATVARDVKRKGDALMDTQVENLRRPFGPWHSSCYYANLQRNLLHLKQHAITMHAVQAQSDRASKKGKLRKDSFQAVARQWIQQKCEEYRTQHRVRHKLHRWKLKDPPAFVARRAQANFLVLKEYCRPCVVSAYIRSLFNGWPTSARMRTMEGTVTKGCVFGCATALDRLEHYAVCTCVWSFFLKPLPNGLGLDAQYRSLQNFLLLEKGMSLQHKLAMAIGVYATSRTAAQLRDREAPNLSKLLLLHARDGHCGSKAFGELARSR